VTDSEFSQFAKRLFVSFPGLWEWLQSNSPDPKATQEVWRETLRPYTFIECLDVLEAWTTGKLKPFEAYERDKVHLIIRSIASRNRDQRAKKEFARNEAKVIKNKTAFDVPGVLEAYKKGREVYEAYKKGEIGVEERDRRCREIVESVM
jgi:hypothetical protein